MSLNFISNEASTFVKEYDEDGKQIGIKYEGGLADFSIDNIYIGNDSGEMPYSAFKNICGIYGLTPFEKFNDDDVICMMAAYDDDENPKSYIDGNLYTKDFSFTGNHGSIAPCTAEIYSIAMMGISMNLIAVLASKLSGFEDYVISEGTLVANDIETQDAMRVLSDGSIELSNDIYLGDSTNPDTVSLKRIKIGRRFDDGSILLGDAVQPILKSIDRGNPLAKGTTDTWGDDPDDACFLVARGEAIAIGEGAYAENVIGDGSNVVAIGDQAVAYGLGIVTLNGGSVVNCVNAASITGTAYVGVPNWEKDFEYKVDQFVYCREVNQFADDDDDKDKIVLYKCIQACKNKDPKFNGNPTYWEIVIDRNDPVFKDAGDYSIASGLWTKAVGHSQAVFGQYNIPDYDDEYSLIVGNGKSHSGTQTFSNSLTLSKDGELWTSKDVVIPKPGSTTGEVIKLSEAGGGGVGEEWKDAEGNVCGEIFNNIEEVIPEGYTSNPTTGLYEKTLPAGSYEITYDPATSGGYGYCNIAGSSTQNPAPLHADDVVVTFAAENISGITNNNDSYIGYTTNASVKFALTDSETKVYNGTLVALPSEWNQLMFKPDGITLEPFAMVENLELVSYSGMIEGYKKGGEKYAENKASGFRSHAEGLGTIAIGEASHAEGMKTHANGNKSHAEGSSSYAIGTSSHAEGSATTAEGLYSHAENYHTTASGGASHAEGSNTTAKGSTSHAEGESTIAEGGSAHTEGAYTRAYGFATHAEGYQTYAGFDINSSSDYDESMNYYKGSVVRYNDEYYVAIQDVPPEVSPDDTNYWIQCDGNATEYSHAEGKGTVAFSSSQHVQGKYNIPDTLNKYADIVGGGDETEPKNISTLTWNGEAWYAKDVVIPDPNYTGKSIKLTNLVGARVYDNQNELKGEIFNTQEASEPPQTEHDDDNNVDYIQTTDTLSTSGGDMGIAAMPPGYNWEAFATEFGMMLDIEANNLIGFFDPASAPYYDMFDSSLSPDTLTYSLKGTILVDGEAPINEVKLLAISAMGITYIIFDESTPGISEGANANFVLEDARIVYCGSDVPNNSAVARFSHAEGTMTTAGGEACHAEGWSTSAGIPGYYSRFEDGWQEDDICVYENKYYICLDEVYPYESWNPFKWEECEPDPSDVSDFASHAEGYNTVAAGQFGSHAEGFSAMAYGEGSHAEGYQTRAFGSYSHAEGSGSKSFGLYSHAESGSKSFGESSHAEGKSNTVGLLSHAECMSFANALVWGDFRVTGNFWSFEQKIPVYNRDYPNKYYTLKDGVTQPSSSWVSSEWDEHNLSELVGGAHAENTSIAIGKYSHAEGNSDNLNASPIAFGESSHAEGLTSRAYGKGSHAEGNAYAHGQCSHAENGGTHAHGWGSHAEGASTYAWGNYSHAEGRFESSSGIEKKEDYGAIGEASHAEGYNTSASGRFSHAEGMGCMTYGYASHAEGQGNFGHGACQHVFGRYNSPETVTNENEIGNYVEIVGNGTALNNRSNARTLDWQGNQVLKGSSSATTHTNTSSRKVKENIEDLTEEEALKILDVTPVTFDFIDEYSPLKNQVGVIAEDIKEIIPSVVSTPKDYDPDAPYKAGDNLMGVDYGKLVPYLIKMVQMQQKEIDELKASINK